MLPGFRFLFVAIMLSLSLLIFGLGAAALFRAAHESFASNSSWRATPDVPFPARPDTTLPVLATLRVEPVTEKPADTPKVAAAPVEPAQAIAEPMTSDQVAALRPAETLTEETAKPAATAAPTAATENAPAPEATPTPRATIQAAPTEETKTATVAASNAASVASEPAITQPEPTAPPTTSSTTVPAAASAKPTLSAAPTALGTDNTATKIATLGGPPVDVSDDASVPETRAVKLPRARPDESVIKRRQQARRAMRRRRLAAARARLLAQQQLQTNPFAQQAFAQPQQNLTTAAPRQ
jgi:hypothetical protein